MNVEPLSRESICAAQNRDPVLSQVVTQLETGVKPARGDVEGGGRKLLSYWSQWGKLFLKDGMVFRRWKREVPRDLSSNLLAQGVVSQVLCALHNHPSAGHLGISKTLEKVQRRFYWHGMREDVKMRVRRCVPCAEVNDTCKLPKAPLINTKVGHPLQRVAIYQDLPLAMSGWWWSPIILLSLLKFSQ